MAGLFCLPLSMMAQSRDWQMQSPETDKVFGVGASRAYTELLKGKTPKPVVVAVLDGGIDHVAT